MLGNPRVQKLLEDLLESGQPIEEVCGDCPDLLPQVYERLQRLRACDARLDALFPVPGSPSLDSNIRSRRLTDLPEIPGYEFQGVLGRGGMGVVYKVRHLRLNREVALKMLRSDRDDSTIHQDRFSREAEAVASLRHPNIVQVFDMGDHNGRPYFTMEYVEGGNLAQRLTGTPQSPGQACAMIAILATAVETAHQNHIVHRDLKPGNVLLTADGTPKISDFGLARRLDDESRLTWVGAAVGTPSYMAPEQAEGKPFAIGPAVDVYALGAILYELLTGRPPYKGETAAETVRRVISQDPTPPSQLNNIVPRDLETICLKCLHKQPQLRYASAAALAADLQSFLDGEAIAARPDSGLARLIRRVHQRPMLVSMMVIGMFCMIMLLGSGLWRVSDRTPIALEDEAERIAREQAVAEDLHDMADQLKKSSWPESRTALERAMGRLGDRLSAEPRRTLDQGARELDLVSELEEIRMEIARSFPGFDFACSATRYEEAFRRASIGKVHEAPNVVADRVRASNIRSALVAALDDWGGCTKDPRIRNWVLTVARKADPDPAGWRDRARNSLMQGDEAALIESITTAPVTDKCVTLFLTLDRQLNPANAERLPFVKHIQQEHPGDFWVNQTLGDVLLRINKFDEAVRYYQAAISVRPHTAVTHHLLGHALLAVGHIEDALRHIRLATDIEPTYVVSHRLLAGVLSGLFQYDEAIERLESAIRDNPDAAILHTELGDILELDGRSAEALIQHRTAVAIEPNSAETQRGLRAVLVRLGRSAEACATWRTALETMPPHQADWFGYAEFCLFIGEEDEYRRARQTLLAKFGSGSDPSIAAQTARACLLLVATDDELRQVISLCERALSVELLVHQENYAVFQFVLGLVAYREGKLDRAISILRGEASQAFGPAPQIVLAMAQHQIGQIADARRTFAAAVLAHDWTAIRVRDQKDWMLHTLRREAEHLILPDLSSFLAGTYQPRDNNERFALLGECLFANRKYALARLYADSFATAPQVAYEIGAAHRHAAMRAAACVGSGDCVDCGNLSEEDRRRWRKQAYDWLKLGLSVGVQLVESGDAASRRTAWAALTRGLADPEFASLREPKALAGMSVEERDEWIAFWKEFEILLNRASSP